MKLLIAACFSFATHMSCLATEAIEQYTSEIEIHEDASMTVIETITVKAEGKQIRRGIYRDFPTSYRDKQGNKYRVAFDVFKVTNNDADEPFKTKPNGNGVRVYIGSENVTLNPGTYRYAIHYKTNRQLGFFDTHDELYWNVTGTQWAFPIKQASARVKLPGYVNPTLATTDAYTGPAGAQGKHFEAYIDDRGVANFKTTTPLKRHEGLTIVYAWPKGIITPPSSSEKFGYLVRDNQHFIVGIIGSVLLTLYYLFTWNRVGRDPQPGVIVAEYQPPPGYSPASMRYIDKMSYDHTCFTAAIINLAVKGYLTITDEYDKYTLVKNQNNVEIDFAPGEAAIADRLFRYDNSITLKQSNHAKISDVLDRHEQSLSNDYENKYFRTNFRFFVIGVIASIALIVGVAVSAYDGGGLSETIFLSIWCSIWWFAIGGGIIRAWNSFRHSHGVGTKVRATIQAVFLIPFVLVGSLVLFQFAAVVNIPTIAFLLFILGLNMLFYQILKAPTLLGRRLLDKVDGFRHYVDIAEKHELDYKNPAGRTPELFERFLPYALALGIDQQWAKQFDAVIAQQQSDGSEYSPVWYSGSRWNAHNVQGFTSSMGNSFSSAVSSSSTAPGSSSGGGGGGSSGGGGGGGGGGGW